MIIAVRGRCFYLMQLDLPFHFYSNYKMQKIRPIRHSDLEGIKIVIDSTGLFPSHLLDDMTHDYLTNSSTQEIWLTVEADKQPIAVAYCAPEKLTEGTYNLYLIATHKIHQGKGIGSIMMEYLENYLKSLGARVLIVETSGLPAFELTRKFYDNCSYTREARIRDFYREGEDKIVFWKKLIN
jgi:ribosomal protein S18 acetylase RimI-like enzyme